MTNHIPSDIPWAAIARSFAGEISAAEAAELQQWVDLDAARAGLIEELRHLWTDADRRQGWDTEAALQRIKRAGDRPMRVLQLTHHPLEAKSGIRRILRIGARAAAAAALLTGGVLLWQVGGGNAEAPAFAQVSTSRGQRAALRLPDGTDVTLAPASTIRYSVDANRGPRTVQLNGEAAFLVTHDDARPFTVHTRYGIATDLGTHFVVQAYPDDSLAVVAVAEGEVSLRTSRQGDSAVSSDDSLLLTPGGGGMATAGGRLAPLTDAEVQRFLGWAYGRLEFQDTPMTEVVAAIGRWYDIELSLADQTIAAKRLTASFKDEPITEVFRLLEASLDVRVDRRGNSAILRAR